MSKDKDLGFQRSPRPEQSDNLQRSLIGASISRFAVAVSRFEFAVGTAVRSIRAPRRVASDFRESAPAMVPAIATVPTRSGRTGRAQQPQWGRKVPAWAWPRVRFRSEAGVHGRHRAGASRWPRTRDSLQWVQPLGVVGLWCGISAWTGTS
jgi:hypothetical protein